MNKDDKMRHYIVRLMATQTALMCIIIALILVATGFQTPMDPRHLVLIAPSSINIVCFFYYRRWIDKDKHTTLIIGPMRDAMIAFRAKTLEHIEKNA